MTVVVLRRLGLTLPILIGLSVLLFAWLRVLPGGPAAAVLGERADPATIASVERAYGFDRPLPEQYAEYVGRLVRLDLGTSIRSREPVVDEIQRRFPATVQLALAGVLLATAVGVPLGFMAAKRRGGALDGLTLAASMIGIAIPVFFLALLLKYAFAVKLGWLPTEGVLSPLIEIPRPTGFSLVDAALSGDSSAFVDAAKHLVLPAIAIATVPLAIITRITRASVIDALGDDHVRTARAKGLPRRLVDRRHVLRNASLPIVTTIGLQAGLLLTGAVLTETVFGIQGVGSWLANAIPERDFPVIQGGVLFLALVFVLVNLAVDLLYAVIDPRIRVG
jgi:peptide/nickel transport system permease protein